MIKKAYLFIVSLVFFSHAITLSQADAKFTEIWSEMAELYVKYSKTFYENTKKTYTPYSTPFWNSCIQNIRNLILGPVNINFLGNDTIQYTTVRGNNIPEQAYEEFFLQNCLSSKTKKLLSNFSESQLLHKSVTNFDCSSTSLAHLYYAGKILEQNSKPNSIIEFGGGFGNLARIFKQALPDVTIGIIDFPEMLAIQYIYLKHNLPGIEIEAHLDATKDLVPGKINLIPVFLLPELNISADVFVSTFAITESPLYTQKEIFKKNFLNCNICYLVGQVEKQNTEVGQDHIPLIEAVRNSYTTVVCNPFHFFAKVPSFELMARL